MRPWPRHCRRPDRDGARHSAPPRRRQDGGGTDHGQGHGQAGRSGWWRSRCNRALTGSRSPPPSARMRPTAAGCRQAARQATVRSSTCSGWQSRWPRAPRETCAGAAPVRPGESGCGPARRRTTGSAAARCRRCRAHRRRPAAPTPLRAGGAPDRARRDRRRGLGVGTGGRQRHHGTGGSLRGDEPAGEAVQRPQAEDHRTGGTAAASRRRDRPAASAQRGAIGPHLARHPSTDRSSATSRGSRKSPTRPLAPNTSSGSRPGATQETVGAEHRRRQARRRARKLVDSCRAEVPGSAAAAGATWKRRVASGLDFAQ